MAANIKLGGGGGGLNLFLVADFFLLQLNAARFQNSMRPRYRLLNARRKHYNDCYTYQLQEYSKKCFPLLISCNEIFGYGGQIYCISYFLVTMEQKNVIQSVLSHS